jgi:hypothetical protein
MLKLGIEMPDTQVLAIFLASLPAAITVLIGILINNARLTDLRHYMDGRFGEVGQRFTDMDRRFSDLTAHTRERFADINHRLDDLMSGHDSRLGQLNHRFDEVDRRLGEVDRRFDEVDRRLSETRMEMNARFDDAKETWRAELRRVEEVLDARLKHLEERDS